MKNKEDWIPSKFVYKNGRLIGSRDPAEVGVSSRLIADIIAHFYDQHLKQHVRGRLLDIGRGKVPFYTTYPELVTDVICVDWVDSLRVNRYFDLQLDLSSDLPFENNE